MSADARIVNDALVADIAAAFGLGSPRSWESLGGGWTTNVRVDLDDDTLVARVHPQWTDHDRLAAIQEVRRVARLAGVPTVLPLAGPGVGTIARLSDGALAELEPYRRHTGRMNTPDRLAAGFRMLGRLHDAMAASDLPDAARVAPKANHVPSDRASVLTALGAERMMAWHESVLDQFAADVVDHVAAVTAAESPLAAAQIPQLVHGDYWDNNVLFAADDLVAVIDFDFMAERWRIDDLALPLYFLLLEKGTGRPGDRERRIARRLLDAYDAGTSRPLSRAERLAVPLAIARQPAWSVGRWVRDLDEAAAREHALAASAEFPVAQAVWADIARWQEILAD